MTFSTLNKKANTGRQFDSEFASHDVLLYKVAYRCVTDPAKY